MARWPEPLARAYETCEALAESHYENFPVASRLLPAPMRPHVAAVYAFARTADDIADEGSVSPAARRAGLECWRRRLHDAVTAPDAGKHPQGGSRKDPENPDTLIVAALAHSIRSLNLPLSLFDDLVSAFGQDTMTTRYDSWAELYDYCRRSANPVGRLVLRIAGYADASLDRSSDALCTALQLTNFWQDFGRDWRAGRMYVPREVVDAHGADERDLGTGRLTPAWTRAIRSSVDRTRAAFEEGREVCDAVGGRLRLELRFTWLGGRRILERVDRGASELFVRRPALGAGDLPLLVWRAARWGR